MSKVNLNTVLLYRGDFQLKPLEKELPLEGVEKLFRGIQFPSRGVTFLYGHRNPAIPFFLEQAATLGLQAAVVDIHVEIGKWIRQKVDLSDDDERGLQFTQFLSLVRAKNEVTDLLDAVWLQELGPERAGDDSPKKGTKYPYLFDKVIDQEPFAHLKVIGYNIETVEVGVVQVATLFDLDAVVGCDGGTRLAEVDLIL
ncbi:hypothetical protein SSTU70S_02816 [Stutzerimonas stutzeri]